MRARHFFCTVLAILMSDAGCLVDADAFQSCCHLADGASAEELERYVEAHPSLSEEHREAILDKRIEVGMSREVVATICGDAIKNQNPQANRWHAELSGPYTAHLYFEGSDDDLKAIIRRGYYLVWP